MLQLYSDDLPSLSPLFFTYFSLGIDVVTSFRMKRENLQELFLRQDVSSCKKIEITYVKHNNHIYIYCRKRSNYTESKPFFNTSDILANYELLAQWNILLFYTSASLFNPCVTNILFLFALWPSKAALCSVCPQAILTSFPCIVWATLIPQVWQSLSSLFYQHPLFFPQLLFKAPKSTLEALCEFSAAFWMKNFLIYWFWRRNFRHFSITEILEICEGFFSAAVSPEIAMCPSTLNHSSGVLLINFCSIFHYSGNGILT